MKTAPPSDLTALAKKRKAPIWGTLSVSAAIHAAIFALLGGVVLFKVLERPPAQFKPPPPVPPSAKIEPRKLEFKVKMQEQQRRGGRPTVSPRITANGISSISLPEIKADIQPIKERVQASFKSTGVGGTGSGVGSGTGGGGGLGLGMSTINMFGVTATAERIAILVDLSPSMVEDEKGGVDGYTALKGEIAKVISGLSPGSFFNVIFFAKNVDVFKSELVIASNENKQAAVDFLKIYYTNRDTPTVTGLTGNYHPKKELPSPGGPTRTDLAIAAAFEFGADGIFLISDGNHWIHTPWEPGEKEKAEKENEANAKQIEARKEADEKEDKKRAKRGLPPKVVEGRGYKRGPGRYNDKDVIAFLQQCSDEEYKPKNKPAPRVYCFGYATTPKEETFMQTVSQKFKGRFKKFRPLVKPIEEERVKVH